MKTKKTSIILLAILLTGGLMAGCGHKASSSRSNSSSQKNTAVQTSKNTASTSSKSSHFTHSTSASSTSIAASSSASLSANSSSTSTIQTNLSSQQIGTLALLQENPNWFKEYLQAGTMYYGIATDNSWENSDVYGDNFITANGDGSSYYYFTVNGDTITLINFDGQNEQKKTLSLNQLIKQYYLTQSQKNEVNGYVSQLKQWSLAAK